MKKFFSLVLAMLMCVCLMAGCGQAEDPAEEPSGEEEPAAEGTAFKFGGVGPLTGDNAIYGTAVMNGAQIAVDGDHGHVEIAHAQLHQRLAIHAVGFHTVGHIVAQKLHALTVDVDGQHLAAVRAQRHRQRRAEAPESDHYKLLSYHNRISLRQPTSTRSSG